MTEPGDGGERGGRSDIDRYLDEMFDRLAGTGGLGRRALAEAEDHLRSAAAEEMARGMPATQAERHAVMRFGASDRIAGQLRRTHWTAPSGTLVSAGLQLTGLAVLGVAGTYLLKALDIAVLLRIPPAEPPPCDRGIFTVTLLGTVRCSDSVSAMHHNIAAGLILLLLGGGIVLVRSMATRQAQLTPLPRRFPLFVAVLFATVALTLFVAGPTTALGERLVGFDGELFGVRQPMGLWPQVIASGVALLIAACAVVAQRRSGRRVDGAPDRRSQTR